MHVTISDIARELDISPSAVSKILNNKGSFSEDLKTRVFKAAKKLNYIPNSMAKNLQQQDSHIIGIIVPDISEIFFSGVICSIEEYCHERGYQIFLCNSHENAEKEMACVNQLYSYRVSGIIIATVRDSIPDDDLLIRGNIPVVFFDNAPTTDTPVSTVCTDNYAAGKYAAELLINNNHTKIATIMGKQTESGARDRYKGFEDAFTENGITTGFDAKFCDFKEESAYKAAMELLAKKEYTGYFVTSSKMLYGCLKAFRESGIKIPEDVSVVGFDVEDAYNTMHYSVTSIIQSEREMGEICAKLLLDRIRNNTECKNIQIPFGVTNKNSVRAV